MIADGEVDFGRDFAATLILALEAKAPIHPDRFAPSRGDCEERHYKKCLIWGEDLGCGVGDKPLRGYFV
jgi:hypothetical protein